MKRWIFFLAWILICSFVLSSCQNEAVLLPAESETDETATLAPIPQQVQTAQTKEDKFPFDSLSNYGVGYFLYGRDRGQTKMLKGKVLFVCILVSDSQSIWEEASIAELKATHQESARVMMEETAPYDVVLEPSFHYIPCTITGSMSREDEACEDGVAEAIGVLGYADPSGIIPAFKETFSSDEVVLLFCVNRTERSFCLPATDAREYEYALLYGKDEDFRHETYHLFGARDYYVPDRAKEWANMCFSESVMLYSSQKIDPLSAYLVGWTDVVSPSAKTFLKGMKGLTSRDWDEE